MVGCGKAGVTSDTCSNCVVKIVYLVSQVFWCNLRTEESMLLVKWIDEDRLFKLYKVCCMRTFHEYLTAICFPSKYE